MMGENLVEKRKSGRTRSLLAGRIIFNNRTAVIDCTVRDISETGARIAFAHPILLPPEFELDVPKRGPAVRAYLRWSNGKDHGVSFVKDPELPLDSLSRAILPSVEQPDNARPGPTVSNAPTVQEVLDEARQRIAHLKGVPVNAVKLELEIDPTK
jgi:hypothetical protein